MARKQGRKVPPLELPEHLVPDHDAWGTPEEEAKRAELNEWLEANDQTRAFYFEWVPAHAAERRRLAGGPPRPPARRKGPLPPEVKRLLSDLDGEA